MSTTPLIPTHDDSSAASANGGEWEVEQEHGTKEHDYWSPVPEEVRKEGGKLFNAYFDGINRFKWVVIVFWLSMFVFGVVKGPQFLKDGNDSQDAPPGSRAANDQAEFVRRFVKKSGEVPVLVVVKCINECRDVRQPELTRFTLELEQTALEYNKTHYNVYELFSWYTYNGTVLDGLKNELVSNDSRVTFITIMVNATQVTYDRYDFVKYLNAFIDSNNPAPRLYSIGLTGFDAMALDSVDATMEQVEKIDAFTLPIAFALLGFMVGSWRLLLVGCFNLGTGILVSFAILSSLIDLGVPRPESASVQLTQVMCMSLSIDYALFMNRRYRNEIKKGFSSSIAAYRSLLYSGHVVLMSGITIAVFFIGFVILPDRTVDMDGISCFTGVATCILVSLTNLPALHLSFPKFFSTFDGLCGYFASDYGVGAPKYQRVASGSLDSSLLEEADSNIGQEYLLSDVTNETIVRKHKVHPMYRSFRFKFTSYITKWPHNIIVVLGLYALVVPLGIQVLDMNINDNIIVGLPRDSAPARRFELIFEEFSGGLFSPFYIVTTVPQGETVMRKEVFNAVGKINQRIFELAALKGELQSVSSPAFAEGKKLPFLVAEALLFEAKKCHDNPPKWLWKACAPALEYKFLYDQAVNEKQDAMITTVIVPFFPFSQETQSFIDDVYEIIDEEMAELESISFLLCGFAVGFDAIMRRVLGLFPVLISATLLGVFIVLSIMLRSLFVPIRLSLTIILPLAAIFGLGKLVYQDGILNWLSPSTTSVNGFFWYLPLLVASMLCGLALDYDVFLYSSIHEHRAKGYDIRAAIVKACVESGGTISAAGIIMTLAFGGMLISDQSTVDMSGFLLATGVLFDTFVVNTMLLPAIMSIGDSVAWYPSKMPMHNLRTLDDPEFTGISPSSSLSETASEGDTSNSP